VEPSALLNLFLFAAAAVFSGYIRSVKTVFSFFNRYQERIEDDSVQDTVQQAILLSKKDGFGELTTLYQLASDASAILAGTAFIVGGFRNYLTLIPVPPIASAGLISASVLYMVTRSILPVLAQASASSAAKPLFLSFSLLWATTGWLGQAINLLNHFMLKKLGYHRKYKMFTESELKSLDPAESPLGETGLEEDEAEMVQNIINFGNMVVKEIFTPRVDCLGLDCASSYQQVLNLLSRHKYTRIPVFRDNIDNILGILHVKDLLYLKDEEKTSGFNLEKIIRSAYFIPRSKKIDDLLSEFRLEHSHLAIVVDEYGGTAGLITMEDILEEIVGEIHDEDDTESPKISKTGEHTYVIDPIITLDDIHKELNILFKPEGEVEIDTLGGYLQYIKGTVPSEGELIKSNGYTFEILQMSGQSIEKVKLTDTNES